MSFLDAIVASGDAQALAAVEAQISAQQALISAQQATLATLETTLATLQTTLGTFTGEQSAIDALQQAAIDAQAAVDTAQAAALAAQQASTAAAEADIVALQAAVTDAQALAQSAYDGINFHTGPNAHQLAKFDAHGFMSSNDFNYIKSLRDPNNVAMFGQVTCDRIGVHPETVLQMTEGPVDALTHLHNDTFLANALTGTTIVNFALVEYLLGRQGLLVVRQDAVGGHAITFTSENHPIMKAAGTTDLQPAQAPNAFTVYTWGVLAAGGAEFICVGKLEMEAV